MIIGQATFPEQGEPGYYVIEGDNLANYDTIVGIDNMESNLVEQNVSARFLVVFPISLRTQVLLATNLEGKGLRN